jgi:tetratricopeptide (TPR) repeat protein
MNVFLLTLLSLLFPLSAMADAGTSGFARALEAEGELASARLEWQRLARQVDPQAPLREEALYRVAALSALQGNTRQALQDFERFGAAFPASGRIPDALYHMMVLGDRLKPNGGAPFAERLQQLFPRHPLAAEAAWYGLWQQAQATGRLPDHAQGPRSDALRQHLADMGMRPTSKAVLAAVLGLVPGLGHLVTGDWRTALMSLLMCALIGGAFYSSLRLRAWGLAVFFGFALLTVYAGSVTSAYSAAYRGGFERLHAAMNGWTDLKPQGPAL